MRSYNSHHSCIKHLARSNCLPNKYANFIDRSTIWRWKNENEDKYLGSELSDIDLLEQLALPSFASVPGKERIGNSYQNLSKVGNYILSNTQKIFSTSENHKRK